MDRTRILGALLLAALATGCEGMPVQLPSILTTEDAQPGAELDTSATATQQPEDETATPQIATPEIAVLPPEPVIDDNPARILGLGPDQVTEILGRPELMRREPPAEIWQYRGTSCVFDVFLYEQAGLVRVTYLEARDDSAEPTAERSCLNQILRARLADPLS